MEEDKNPDQTSVAVQIDASLLSESNDDTSSELDLAAMIANSAQTATKRREMLAKRVLDTHDRRSFLPNRVAFQSDVEALITPRFHDGLVYEQRGQLGIFLSTEDPHSFEFVLLETLKTEMSDLYPQLERAVKAIDPGKQALMLFGSAVMLTEKDADDRKVRRPYHLVRLRKAKTSVEKRGIGLDLPADTVSPNAMPVPEAIS